MDIHASWAITRGHLEAAYNQLPSPVKEDVSGPTAENVREWLNHNELGLVLDELEGLGQLNNCSSAFWRELAAAAQSLNLHDHVARYIAKLE
jgi:hypothetical protein